jgi:bifunctional DNase/RNase
MVRLTLLLTMLGVLAACPDAGRVSTSASDAVVVRVARIGIDRHSELPVVVLEEIGGERMLPIWIGSAEARSIQAVIDSREWPRPNTHDLTRQLLLGLDARVERVTVTELRGSTYYALVRVTDGSEAREFDARPSDAIALALRFQAPVYVHTALLTPAARGDDAPAPAGEGGGIRL